MKIFLPLPVLFHFNSPPEEQVYLGTLSFPNKKQLQKINYSTRIIHQESL